MTIGIDIRALSNKKLTGIGKYIYYAIENILLYDKSNKYILISSGVRKNAYSHLKFDADNLSYRHISIPNKLLNLFFYLGIGKRWCHQFSKDIDVLWMPNLNFYQIDKSVPLVLTVHDLSFLHDREFYSLKRRYWHKTLKIDRLVKKAAQIIAVSANTKRDIVRFFPTTQDKIQVINPGVHTVALDDAKATELLKKYNVPEKYFVYVGTLEPRKNIASIIKAFDRLHLDYPDIYLLIAGGKGWVYKNILKNINKRNYVHYLDYVDSPAKNALYYKSLGLIWPSFYEGFGFPPMEALYYNIPVIVSYKTSLPETLGDQALYVDPYNISDIYENMKFIIEDKEFSKQYTASAKNFKLPSWPEQAKQIVDLFNNIKK
ncbi:glycosyltransferase family 4 protein [Patescibacteria group bacterium]|nr:glycosyltransferase family 4 protein [Patescibacteria group bacterium]